MNDFARARPLHHRHRLSRRRQNHADPPRLANAQGRRLAVIVNEFGDVGIDGEILKGCGNAACPEENIVELANGCLCCTVADEFVPALDAILAKRRRRAHRHRNLRPRAAEAAGAGVPLAGDQEPRHRRRRRGRGRRRGARRWPRGARSRRAGAAARQPTPRSTTTIRSKRFSRIRSPAPISSCSTSATCIDAPASKRRKRRSPSALPRSVKVIAVADGKVDQTLLLGLGVGTEDDIANRRTRHDAEEDHDHDDFDSFRRAARRDRRSVRAGRARRRACGEIRRAARQRLCRRRRQAAAAVGAGGRAARDASI